MGAEQEGGEDLGLGGHYGVSEGTSLKLVRNLLQLDPCCDIMSFLIDQVIRDCVFWFLSWKKRSQVHTYVKF